MSLLNVPPRGTSMSVEEAIAKGYRIVSRAHLIAARINKSTWRSEMAASHPDGMRWVATMGDRSAADHYRRCFSKDKIKIPAEWVGLMPNSSYDVADRSYLTIGLLSRPAHESMDSFFTITDADTTYTNSRSQRFACEQDAVSAAEARIAGGKSPEVFVLRAVALVKRSSPPIEVVKL